jgi:hypothetical protein
MQEVPKAMKRLVRDWAAVAHDRDLSSALLDLRAQFDRWQRGEITAYDLNHLIHEYHQGPSREIWKRYDTNHLAPAVASAVAGGVLTRQELPVPLLEHLAGLIEFFEADRSAS